MHASSMFFAVDKYGLHLIYLHIYFFFIYFAYICTYNSENTHSIVTVKLKNYMLNRKGVLQIYLRKYMYNFVSQKNATSPKK